MDHDNLSSHELSHCVMNRDRSILGPMENETPFADIGQRIKWHREVVMQMTQAEYASAADLKRTQVANWESGRVRISFDGVVAIKRTYGLSIDFVIDGSVDALSANLTKAWLGKSRNNTSQ